MAYTTITAGTIGIADGDQNPSPVDGTVRITPRFPSAATTDGLIATGPVIVEVVGGAMPKTDIPALTDATASVEFHLYDRNAGPVHLPATEIPLEPGATINLREYLSVAVDQSTGATIIRGPRGRGITSVSGSGGNIVIEWEDGAESAVVPMPDAIPGPRGPKGDDGSVAFEGIDPGITVNADSVVIGNRTVPSVERVSEMTEHSPQVVNTDGEWAMAETDDDGKISRAVDSQGRTWLTLHPDSPGVVDTAIAGDFRELINDEWSWAVADEAGLVALGVRSDGTAYAGDPTGGLPYDVVLLAGQSNMQGRGAPPIERDPVPGVNQFPSAHRDDAGFIVPAIDPLQHPGSMFEDRPHSLAIPFGRSWRERNPGRRVLLVPAAYGGSGFTTTSGAHWDWEQPTVGTPLAQMAVAQTRDAIAAAGPNARLAGILWHQGEADSSMGAAYAEKLDGLITWFRSELGDVPVVVGQMSPDREGGAGDAEIDLANQQTPSRLLQTAFAPTPHGLHNPGDTTHLSTRAHDLLGPAFAEALERASFNRDGDGPIAAERIMTNRSGDAITVSWDPAWCRVTGYRVEWRTPSGAWSEANVIHAFPLALSATFNEAGPVEVRVTTINDYGESTPIATTA